MKLRAKPRPMCIACGERPGVRTARFGPIGVKVCRRCSNIGALALHLLR